MMPKQQLSLPKGARIGAEYSGEVEVLRVYYRSQDWAALRVRSGDHSFSIIGSNTLSHAIPGARIRIKGVWVKNQYGLQVDVSDATVLSVDDTRGFVESFLSHCKSARRQELRPIINDISEIFGEDTEAAIIDGRAFSSGLGISGRYERMICRILSSKQRREARMAELARLHELGINAANAEIMYGHFKEDAAAIASNIPYELMVEVGCISFPTADKIAKGMDVDYDPSTRMQAIVRYGLEIAEENGHCFVPLDTLTSGITKIIRATDGLSDDQIQDMSADIQNAIRVCEHSRAIVRDESDRIYSYATDDAEATVAMNVAIRLHARTDDTMIPPRMSDSFDIDDIVRGAQEQSSVQYSDEQILALKRAVEHPISIVSGGPGTGKTTICRAIVRAFEMCGMSYKLCGPTGRGAKRLEESVERKASTIHRLLEFDPQVNEWGRSVRYQLPTDGLIVDEASMVDIHLFRALLDAMPGLGRMVIVGDVDQLPSVGPGKVLADLISSETVPVTMLERIFRQNEENSIVQISHDIRDGNVRDIPSPSHADVGADGCWMVKRSDPASLQRTIPRVIERVAAARELDYQDIQVLTPMRKGMLGTGAINAILQDHLNPNVVGTPCYWREKEFRVGDRVMQTKNDYDNDVYNGDMGIVIKTENKGIKIDFDGRKEVQYYGSQLDGIEHAYSITIHKSQGSEFPVGVIVMHNKHSRMLRRNLLYTAISRCTDQAFVIGQPSAVASAISDDREQVRYTSLAERIRELTTALGADVVDGVGFEW